MWPLLVHRTFPALVLSDYLHCRASGTALDKKLVWISYSTWMKSSLPVLTTTFCLSVFLFFFFLKNFILTAFGKITPNNIYWNIFGSSTATGTPRWEKQTSEFSSGLRAVINFCIAVRMKNSKSSCPAEHFLKHSGDLRVYFLQTSSQPWTPSSLGHFTKWDRCAEVVRRNYWSTTKHLWWCLRAWAIPVKVSFLKNQWVLKCFAGLSP